MIISISAGDVLDVEKLCKNRSGTYRLYPDARVVNEFINSASNLLEIGCIVYKWIYR